MKKGVTLIELVIAISLLGVILLTATAVDVSVRRFFNASDRSAALQNELNPVLLRMKKDINTAVGQPGNSGIQIQAGNNRIAVRRDVNISGVPNVNSAGNYNDDTWTTYALVGNQIQFYRGNAPWVAVSSIDIIADKITAFQLGSIISPFIAGYSIGANIQITACNNPAAGGCGTAANPALDVITTVYALSQAGR